MSRIAFDLDGCLIEQVESTSACPRLRPGIVNVLHKLKAAGHTLVIYTFASRPWWRKVRALHPILLEFFTEVFTKEEFPQHVTTGRGFPEAVKDIRLINADVLVDNDPAHHEWAKRHGLAHRYVLVSTFGEG